MSTKTYARAGNGIAVFELADLLRRAAYVEKAMLRQQSGWFLRLPAWEDKHTFGYHIWNHAEHAGWLMDRLRYLRGGNPDASVDPALRKAVDTALHAPDPESYIMGAYMVLKKALKEFYQHLLEECDPVANAFDIRMVRRILPELEEQIEWAEERLRENSESSSSHYWAQHISDLLRDAGGIAGDSSGAPQTGSPEAEATSTATVQPRTFGLPGHIVFDKRITAEPLMPHEEKEQLPFDQAVLEQFRVFFNEIYAASILATIVHDSFEQDMSWDMIHWFSRHFWDEIRHSQFGSSRLQELGSAPDRCNQQLYRNSVQLPLLHRITYLALVLEFGYMPRKKPRFQQYGEQGDMRSRLFADHDWSDEMNHVRNARAWLQTLLEDDARDVEQLKEETIKKVETIVGGPVKSASPW